MAKQQIWKVTVLPNGLVSKVEFENNFTSNLYSFDNKIVVAGQLSIANAWGIRGSTQTGYTENPDTRVINDNVGNHVKLAMSIRSAMGKYQYLQRYGAISTTGKLIFKYKFKNVTEVILGLE